jgi:TnpA family transposase
MLRMLLSSSAQSGTRLIHRLGYQFSPRLADIGGTRFWRVDGKADYGALDGLASSLKLIRCRPRA